MSLPPPGRRTRLDIERLEDRLTPTAAFDPGRVLVTFADAGPTAAQLAALQSAPAAAGVSEVGLGVYRVDLAAGASVESAAPALARLPGVRAAQPDYRVTVAATPNDPAYSRQWALTNPNVAAAAAWSVGTGTGRTIVAVVDTGVDVTHPDLAANLWRNPREVPGNGRDDDGNGFVDDVHGADFLANTGNPADDVGHGTHVAGIIGAVGNNGRGGSGVLWRTRIMALKFMGPTGGYTSDAVRAIDYAVANGAKVINNSWGGGGYDAALAAAIRRAQDAGVVVVAAAGNYGSDNDRSTFYPASYVNTHWNVVTVAATDSRDQLAGFSNFGRSSVTLAAPGVSIYSTVPGGGYAEKSGTSMAAPFASGALALLWDRHPDWSWQQVIWKLQASVDTLPSLAGTTFAGGRLDLGKLMDAPVTVVPPVAPPPPAPGGTGPRVVEAVVGGPRNGVFDRAWVKFSKPVDPASLAGSVALQLPGGGVTTVSNAVPVAGKNNTEFTVVFARGQTAAGAYTLTVSYLLRDAAGARLDQNGNGVNGEPTDWFVRRVALGAGTTPSGQGVRAAAAPPPARVAAADLRGAPAEVRDAVLNGRDDRVVRLAPLPAPEEPVRPPAPVTYWTGLTPQVMTYPTHDWYDEFEPVRVP